MTAAGYDAALNALAESIVAVVCTRDLADGDGIECCCDVRSARISGVRIVTMTTLSLLARTTASHFFRQMAHKRPVVPN